MIEKELEWEMVEPYFTSETDTQYATMNSLFKAGAKVWHCVGELGRCLDPIIIDNVPMRITVGDFPFETHESWWIGEIKFNKARYIRSTTAPVIRVSRDIIEITNKQVEMLLKGIAILIIIAEPVPEAVGLGVIEGATRSDCEVNYRKFLQVPLSQNEIPYWLYDIDKKHFKVLWNNYLKQAPVRNKGRGTGEILSRRMSMRNVDLITPETRSAVYLRDFQTDKVGSIIVEKLKTF